MRRGSQPFDAIVVFCAVRERFARFAVLEVHVQGALLACGRSSELGLTREILGEPLRELVIEKQDSHHQRGHLLAMSKHARRKHLTRFERQLFAGG
jgi:hypothetical protein